MLSRTAGRRLLCFVTLFYSVTSALTASCSLASMPDSDGSINGVEFSSNANNASTAARTVTIETLHWNPLLTRYLPVDPLSGSQTRQVVGSSLSYVRPTPITHPELIAYSASAGQLLDLDLASQLRDQADKLRLASHFSGNVPLPGAPPSFAHCYGGHQFGHWAKQLGDGRAITIGEIRNAKGEQWEISLKGAGKTPYSRNGDGRAVLRSSVREFLCSEFMAALGIPTTRALSLIGGDDTVRRDQFYDGHVQQERVAVVARLSPSFIRFGSFEIFYHRQDHHNIKTLADYTIAQHFPHILVQEEKCEGSAEKGVPECVGGVERYRQWFEEIVNRTAKMIAMWQSIGFAHGVLNTDNMSILGLTIDYGPFGFMEHYDPGFVPNTSDDEGRYAFDKQPSIGLWNLEKLALALSPLLSQALSRYILETHYYATFNNTYHTLMLAKLGLHEQQQQQQQQPQREEDDALIQDLLKLMAEGHLDYTNTFWSLSTLQEYCERDSQGFSEFRQQTKLSEDWVHRYCDRMKADLPAITPQLRKAQMNRTNPRYTLRNHLAQLAIDRAEAGDYAEIWNLFERLQTPFADISKDGDNDAMYIEPSAERIRVSCSS